MKRAFLAAVAATSLSLPAQASSVADPFSSFVVLGDSLSDPGNIPQVFWEGATGGAPFLDVADNPATLNVEDGGTFSNGLVWANVLTQQFAAQFKPTFNLASGGASTGATAPSGTGNDLDTQQANAEGFLASPFAGARPLMAYWFGANDIFDAFGTGGAAAVPGAVAAATAAIADAVERSITLYGVSDFLVMNLPDLSLIPRFNGATQPEKDFASGVTAQFNLSLLSELSTPAATGANITVLDVNALFQDATTNPGAFGFTNVSDACVTYDAVPDTSPGAGPGDTVIQRNVCTDLPGVTDVDQFLFIDDVHPTAPAHAAIGSAAASALAPVPLPAGVWLMLAGIGALALRRRAA